MAVRTYGAKADVFFLFGVRDYSRSLRVEAMQGKCSKRLKMETMLEERCEDFL